MSEPLSISADARGVSRESVVDEVANSLRTEVLAGNYAPGQYLPPARELAEAYGVTRTSLKHALVRLAQAGLVETKHGVGTRVLDFVQQGGVELLPMLVNADAGRWAQAIFEVRTEIGAVVAVRAARHATTGQREELATAHTRVRDAATADAAQLAECEWHRVLARATGNGVYPLLMNVVLDSYLQQRQALRGPFVDPHDAADRLAPLSAAVCSGMDSDVVHARATEYLERTGELMITSMVNSDWNATSSTRQ